MFGGGGSTTTGGGNTSTPSSPSTPKSPAYTPSLADPSIAAAGITGLKPLSKIAGLSNDFTSIIGAAGGLGRKPSLSGRSLIGGA